MDRTKFIEDCFNRGICRKARAVEYTKNKPKDYKYTEDDIQNVFSFDDSITNGNRNWASYVSGDPEDYSKPNYWAFEAEHAPIRARRLVGEKLKISEEQ